MYIYTIYLQNDAAEHALAFSYSVRYKYRLKNNVHTCIRMYVCTYGCAWFNCAL